MSKKARRRPSWKAYKKWNDDPFILHLLNEENDRLMEIIRIPSKGYVGRQLIQQYGREGAEQYLKESFIQLANEIISWKKYNEATI